MEEPYLYGRDTYEEIREFVERMYDEHAAHPELYHFVGFEGETNRVIDEMSTSSELVECLLFIALAESAINREKPMSNNVIECIEKIFSSDVLQKYFDELLSIEKEQIVKDLNHIAEYLKNIRDNY